MKKLIFVGLTLLAFSGCAAIPYEGYSYSGGGGIVGYPGGFDNCYLNGGWNCDVFDYGHGYWVKRRDWDDNVHPVFHDHDNNSPYPNWHPEWHPNPQPEWHQNFHQGWGDGGNNWRPERADWDHDGFGHREGWKH